MTLEQLFSQLGVPLWGIGSLGTAVQRGHEYRYIAFCLPYDSAAIEALPDDRLAYRCRCDLGDKANTIYEAITAGLSGCTFSSYDDVDRELGLREKGISQKVLGYLAGLGWIGRSSLLVTPDFGPRVRIGTIFTRDDIGAAGHPLSSSCGECVACSNACPANAISTSGYDVVKCRQVVTDSQGKYKTFCGLCMKACPIGQSRGAAAPEAETT